MAVPGVSKVIVVKHQTSSPGRERRATWVRKSNEGKVWLTLCRIKARIVPNKPGSSVEYLCQMQNADLMEGIWEVVKRCNGEGEALDWLYRR